MQHFLWKKEGWGRACFFPRGTGSECTQMFDYSLFFINTLWDYYEATKDKETLQELWPVALRQIELAEEQLDEKMLVGDSDVLGWCFCGLESESE